jgi:hypothetical protein
MRKFIIIGAALAALVVPSVANASVAVENGVGTVGKGDVQSALKWNNKAFDDGALSLKFTASAEKVIADYKMSCFNGNTGAIDAEVSHTIIYQAGAATVTNTPIYNAGNGKQITGFKLTGQASGFTAKGGNMLRTVPCPVGSFSYMNLGQGDLFGKTLVTGGLKVNGVELPNTPVEITA